MVLGKKTKDAFDNVYAVWSKKFKDLDRVIFEISHLFIFLSSESNSLWKDDDL